MSSGQKPRTPRYFPRMKVRGARRKRRAPFERAAGWFDRVGIAATQSQAAIAAAFAGFIPARAAIAAEYGVRLPALGATPTVFEMDEAKRIVSSDIENLEHSIRRADGSDS